MSGEPKAFGLSPSFTDLVKTEGFKYALIEWLHGSSEAAIERKWGTGLVDSFRSHDLAEVFEEARAKSIRDNAELVRLGAA